MSRYDDQSAAVTSLIYDLIGTSKEDRMLLAVKRQHEISNGVELGVLLEYIPEKDRLKFLYLIDSKSKINERTGSGIMAALQNVPKEKHFQYSYVIFLKDSFRRDRSCLVKAIERLPEDQGEELLALFKDKFQDDSELLSAVGTFQPSNSKSDSDSEDFECHISL